MNSIWNKNIELLKQYFPQLYATIGKSLYSIDSDCFNDSSLPFTVEKSKCGLPTASCNGIQLHSKYNPQREAQQAASDYDSSKYKAAAFFSFGIGWTPSVFCTMHPEVPVFLIEPDINRFNLSLNVINFESIITHRNTVILAGAEQNLCQGLLKDFTSSDLRIYAVAAQNNHAKEYFEQLYEYLKHNEQKEEINNNTLERFAHLWLKNSCRNLPMLAEKDGIEKYRNLGKNIPFLILAAGPSLSSILPELKDLSQRCITVCVDTSLHACLKAGVEPDFIILVDPQYACARHLEFLSSPSSVLITESAVWPSVFRFPCKEINMCSSMFPIGQYFEKQLGSKGKLGAGGSVTTTAWDFARICGAKEILIAGMDLGFPGKETHVRGSQFEERSHRLSNRFVTAEKDSIVSLMGANPQYKKDYLGSTILTDSRMTLFSWWFESNVKKSAQEGQITYTITPQSMAIDGIKVIDIKDILSRSTAEETKKQFFNQAQNMKTLPKADFETVLKDFTGSMEELLTLSKKGINLCNKAIENRLLSGEVSGKLALLDRQILQSGAKDAASLVFPTQRQLDEKAAKLPKDTQLASIYMSRLIYTELFQSAKEYIDELKNI